MTPRPANFIARKALGTSMRSTPLVADGKLYLCTNEGRWYILKPTDDGVEVVHQLRLTDEDSDGSPAVSHGRIFLPTSAALYCLADPTKTPSADPLPAGAQREADLRRRQNRSDCKSSPTTCCCEPGEQAGVFRIRAFNANGQFLKELPASDVQLSPSTAPARSVPMAPTRLPLIPAKSAPW